MATIMYNQDKKLLTSSQASLVLGVCTKTLNQWANDGDVQYYTTRGGHKRFARETLINFLTRDQQPSDE